MVASLARSVLAVLFLLVLAGCASRTANRAPVEDRGVAASATAAAAAPGPEAVAPAVRQPLGFENAGKPGYYTVKPGDTLIRIGLDNGQSWRDVARWNNLENPNVIEVGQVLRVVPPTTAATAGAAAVVTKPVTSSTVTAAAVGPSQSPSATPTVIAPPVTVSRGAGGDEDVTWIWPARGVVVSEFDEIKTKGIDIAGALRDPVVAAADGRVIYVGTAVRGLGNLVIVRHNGMYLTAYAHNETILVKEDHTVRRGQKIAEMGSSDTDRVKLHFEVRRLGKPVDPAKYLPPR